MLPAVTASYCIHVAWESGLSERPDSSKTCESSCVWIWISDTMSEVSRRLCLIWIVIILSFHSWQRSDTFKLCFTGWENAVKGLIIRQIFSRKFSFKQDSEKWNYSQVTSDLFNFHLSIFCFLSRLGLQGQHSKQSPRPSFPTPTLILGKESLGHLRHWCIPTAAKRSSLSRRSQVCPELPPGRACLKLFTRCLNHPSCFCSTCRLYCESLLNEALHDISKEEPFRGNSFLPKDVW